MKPAFSVLLFTVLSGAGLGALAIIALLDLAALVGMIAPLAPPRLQARAAAIALLLVVAGLCASTLHLANPKNAWRSWTRWRTSWLSREAVLSLAFMPVAVGLVACWWWDVAPTMRVLFAVATLLLAWMILVCTAMIYASLKPIRQWHTRHVPANFLLYGHASGALLVVVVLRSDGYEAASLVPLVWLVWLLFVAAAIGKLLYWRFLRSDKGAITLEQAIGVPRGVRPPPTPDAPASIMAARLFDMGHAGGTFLTREFVINVAARNRTWIVVLMWSFGFVLPMVWLALGLARWQGAVLAMLACMIGMLAERWLFFADARHTVRLYHGEPTT
ncbi:MAG: DmsC/YnfH family molybdoenzyme membrane anchor subunit [Betaproteobacteria bacterium]